MIKEKALSRSVRVILSSGLLVGMGVVAMPAFAQDAKIETVSVTGTRILTPGTTSNSPISSIGSEEIKASQPMAVEEFFKNLPAAVPAIGPGVNNGTGGAATIDLRGLGSNRTLVLVNGRRFVPYSLAGVVDTNSVPIALISRVDLFTGGASVVYGADAISGVVNFNLKKNFTGVDLSTSYGTSGERDAKRMRTDLTIGSSLADGRGNVVLSLGKTSVDPLMQGQRDIGKTTLSSVTGLFAGSSTTSPGVFNVGVGTGGTSTLAGNWQINPTTGTLVQPIVTYNTNPLNYFVTGLERTQATAMGNFKINDNADVYAELFSTNAKVASTLAESGTFGNTFQVPIGNAYLPEAARQQICLRRGITVANCVAGNTTLVPMTISRRFAEMGPRFNNFDNKTLQYTVGVKGDAVADWTYDAYFSRGQADQVQTRAGWGSLAKVKQALNAVSKTACLDTTGGCVPLNVFGDTGSITAAQLAYINLNALLLQSVTQDVGAVSFSGDLGNKIVSPFANKPINMAFGLENRKLTAGTASDSASQIQGEVLGTGAPTPDRTGTFSLREYSVEALVPLVKDMPFVKSLTAEVGYRQTEFTSGGNSQSYGSYKAGGEWSPISALRFRGMSQKATRAPNVNELFAPLVTGLSNLATDPCQGNLVNAAQANTAGTLSNLCRLTGVPTSVMGSLPTPSSGQINSQSGGNPNLTAEEAKTKTLGFVWEPLPKLALSLDYFSISIEKAISSPSTRDVLDGCYSTTFNPSLAFNASCGLIGRSSVNGTFNGVESSGVFTASSNLGKQKTTGFDIAANYRLPATALGLDSKMGNFDVGFAATKVTSYTFQATPASVNRDCLGYYSVACGAPTYKHKFNQRTSWAVDNVIVGYNWRYVSSAVVEPLAGTFLPAYSSVPAYNYVDLSAVWNLNKTVRLNFSVANVFDKQPPLVGNNIAVTSANGGNTMPQAYDTVGRYFTVGLSTKF